MKKKYSFVRKRFTRIIERNGQIIIQEYFKKVKIFWPVISIDKEGAKIFEYHDKVISYHEEDGLVSNFSKKMLYS